MASVLAVRKPHDMCDVDACCWSSRDFLQLTRTQLAILRPKKRLFLLKPEALQAGFSGCNTTWLGGRPEDTSVRGQSAYAPNDPPCARAGKKRAKDRPPRRMGAAARTIVRPRVHVDTEEELRSQGRPSDRRAALGPQFLPSAAACLR